MDEELAELKGQRFCSVVLLRCDCVHRGWCDSPQSVLRCSYEPWPIAHNPQCVLFVCGWVVCYTALVATCQVCGVIEDLVLFTLCVQFGCKFHWPPGLYAVRLTRHCAFRAAPTTQTWSRVVGASVASMWCVACHHLLSNSQHSLRLGHPYS